jgi:four helix bundle protein
MNEKGFEGLEVWQKARELMIVVHKRIAPLLPAEEKWDLTHQIRSSSKSVMANIAEGHGRYYFGDTIRFCYIARGSLDKTVSHLVTAMDLGYVTRPLGEEVRAMADEVRRMLNGYIRYVRSRRRGENEPGSNLSVRERRPVYAIYHPSSVDRGLVNKAPRH